MKRPAILTALLVLTSLLVTVAPGVAAARDKNPELYRPDARVMGHSRAFWASNLATWEQEVPVPANPLTNVRSRFNCTTKGLAVAYVGYPTSVTGRGPCRIPRGMPFQIAPIGWECSTAEGRAGLLDTFHGRTWGNLRRCAKAMFERDFGPGKITLRMWVDGKRIQDVYRYVVTTQRRVARLPERNVWEVFAGAEVPAGRTKTISRLFSFMFKPMSVGTHRLRIHAVAPALSPEPLRGTWKLRVGRR